MMEILCFVNINIEIIFFYSDSSILSTGIIVDTIRSMSTGIIVNLYII